MSLLASPSKEASRSQTPADANLNSLSQEYAYDDLYAATEGFSAASRMGKGTYGSVYKGTLRDGTEVAVKALSRPNEAGFREEVELLSRFRHPNLVILMGFARRAEERYLVYELLLGGDVCAKLQQQHESFTWRARVGVAVDAALGLSHLHNSRPQVYHRDIKTQNILMDKNGSGKMADFGLALLAKPNTDSLMVEHTAGTIGYADPLYICTGKVTERTEVYSFGMVLLELLTGRPPALQHGDGRIEYQFNHISGDLSRVKAMVDPRGAWPALVVDAIGNLALRCTQETMEARPSFVEVVTELRIVLREHQTQSFGWMLPSTGSIRPFTAGSGGGAAGPIVSAQPAADLGLAASLGSTGCEVKLQDERRERFDALSRRQDDAAPRTSEQDHRRPAEAAREAVDRLLRAEAARKSGAIGSCGGARSVGASARIAASSSAQSPQKPYQKPITNNQSASLLESCFDHSDDASMVDCGPTAQLDCGLPSQGYYSSKNHNVASFSGMSIADHPLDRLPQKPTSITTSEPTPRLPQGGYLNGCGAIDSIRCRSSSSAFLRPNGLITPSMPSPLKQSGGSQAASSSPGGLRSGFVGNLQEPAFECISGAERDAGVQRLQDLGFSEHQSVEAFKRCSTVASAVDWILSPGREWNQ